MNRYMAARYSGKCYGCQQPIMVSDTICMVIPGRRIVCRPCGKRMEQRDASTQEDGRQAYAHAKRLGGD